MPDNRRARALDAEGVARRLVLLVVVVLLLLRSTSRWCFTVRAERVDVRGDLFEVLVLLLEVFTRESTTVAATSRSSSPRAASIFCVASASTSKSAVQGAVSIASMAPSICSWRLGEVAANCSTVMGLPR
ncbi:MAG: hypothetical protein R3A48_17535 [Polyangiales bacterium]